MATFTVPELVLKKTDHQHLSSLVLSAPPALRELLEQELDRARVLPDEEIPADVITMNSEVTYIDLGTQTQRRVTLVYPRDSNADEGRISILTPIGSALIGLRVGQSISWPLPTGKEKQIRILEVRN